MFSDLAAGLLIARVALGLAFAAHGSQKALGWFGGPGLAGASGVFEKLGFRPSRLFAAMAGFGEMLAGVLIAIGLFGAIGPMIVIATMTVAVVAVHWKNGFFAAKNGYELAFLYATGAVAIAFGGYGSLSLDTAFGWTALSRPAIVWALLALGFAAGAGALALRRAPAATPATSQ
jgi:putative oxidoreductase